MLRLSRIMVLCLDRPPASLLACPERTLVNPCSLWRALVRYPWNFLRAARRENQFVLVWQTGVRVRAETVPKGGKSRNNMYFLYWPFFLHDHASRWHPICTSCYDLPLLDASRGHLERAMETSFIAPEASTCHREISREKASMRGGCPGNRGGSSRRTIAIGVRTWCV